MAAGIYLFEHSQIPTASEVAVGLNFGMPEKLDTWNGEQLLIHVTSSRDKCRKAGIRGIRIF